VQERDNINYDGDYDGDGDGDGDYEINDLHQSREYVLYLRISQLLRSAIIEWL
jgi:hypothetical protein